LSMHLIMSRDTYIRLSQEVHFLRDIHSMEAAAGPDAVGERTSHVGGEYPGPSNADAVVSLGNELIAGRPRDADLSRKTQREVRF
jgi:hypothetical protein